MLADEWTEEKRREFTIKDNVGFGEWEWDTLKAEWDIDKLEEWGLDVPKIEKNEDFEKQVGEIEVIEIRPYKKTHVLLSFDPEILIEIKDYLQIIKDINGIEYEQSSN